jgi:hypothetical protein
MHPNKEIAWVIKGVVLLFNKKDRASKIIEQEWILAGD